MYYAVENGSCLFTFALSQTPMRMANPLLNVAADLILVRLCPPSCPLTSPSFLKPQGYFSTPNSCCGLIQSPLQTALAKDLNGLAFHFSPVVLNCTGGGIYGFPPLIARQWT